MNDASSPYLAFVSLSRLDLIAYDKSLLIKRLTREIDDALNELQISSQLFAAAQEKLHTVRKAIDENELELKILKDRERESKRKLDTVASVKEYTSLQHEIDDLARAQDSLENAGLTLLQEGDEAQLSVDKTQQAFHNQQEKTDLIVANKKKQILSLEQEISEAHAERGNVARLVQPELLAQYEAMREKVPNPAVPVVDNACSSCLYAITAQDLAAIRRHKIVTCKDCYRFLYENI